MKDRRNKVQLMENVACDVMLCSPVLRGEKSIDSDVVGKGVRSQLVLTKYYLKSQIKT